MRKSHRTLTVTRNQEALKVKQPALSSPSMLEKNRKVENSVASEAS